MSKPKTGKKSRKLTEKSIKESRMTKLNWITCKDLALFLLLSKPKKVIKEQKDTMNMSTTSQRLNKKIRKLKVMRKNPSLIIPIMRRSLVRKSFLRRHPSQQTLFGKIANLLHSKEKSKELLYTQL